LYRSTSRLVPEEVSDKVDVIKKMIMTMSMMSMTFASL
jgi:hypothetical protein